jgi:hypothetical protein
MPKRRSHPSQAPAARPERDLYIRRGLATALAWAQAQLAAVRPEDYADERAFKTVLTRRAKAVRRVERMLAELGGGAPS